jgi:hypothetical protein
MRRVNAVREERGGERKILRGLKIGEEIWRGTPFVSLGAEVCVFFLCNAFFI